MLRPETEIMGLYLTGQDILMMGIWLGSRISCHYFTTSTRLQYMECNLG